MQIETFFDPATKTLTYVVYDADSGDAVIVDPVLDYDPLRVRTSTDSVEQLVAFLHTHKLRLRMVLETHAHADHLSASQYLKQRFGAPIGIGARIHEVQDAFRVPLDLPAEVALDGSQFDRLFEDGEEVELGTLRFQVIATPGHTPACVSYLFGDCLFTGDALFIEDYGTGRCDFPKGSADALYSSVHDRLYALPDATRVFVGHDYQPDGRFLRYETNIGTSKQHNVQLRQSTAREEFVAMRTARDATLAPPQLLYPSVRVNVDAGKLPSERGTGRRYLSLPLSGEWLPKTYQMDSFLARCGEGEQGGHEIEPSQLLEARPPRLVDVRDADEFDGPLGHVLGAERVPLAELAHAARSWPRDQPVVLICRSGRRSLQAVAELRRLGFVAPINLRGGMEAWHAAALPVQRHA